MCFLIFVLILCLNEWMNPLKKKSPKTRKVLVIIVEQEE